MNYSNFARRLGSKDKKKRNMQKAAGAVGGLAVAGLAGAALGRYGLKQLGKRVKKAQPLLAGSSGSSQKALPATSSYRPTQALPPRARRTNQTQAEPSNGVFVTQPKNRTSATVNQRQTIQNSNNVIRERKPPTPNRKAPAQNRKAPGRTKQMETEAAKQLRRDQRNPPPPPPASTKKKRGRPKKGS